MSENEPVELTSTTAEPMEASQTAVVEEASTEEAFAIIAGKQVTELPEDLYIPPGALKVFLEAFQGPLDLLLYLIRKQNLDILDIPIAKITHQYVKYIELMNDLQLELAAEYLLMAAMLAEIKSRLLLPRQPTEEEGTGEDPRAELVRRLQEYERFKQAAQDLDELERVERDTELVMANLPTMDTTVAHPDMKLDELLNAFKDVMERAKLYTEHTVEREPLSIRERMTEVLNTVTPSDFTLFRQLFRPEEGRMGVVVTLIAILELLRQSAIELVQAEAFSPIYIKSKT